MNQLSSTGIPFPTLDDIRATYGLIRDKINVTPVWNWKRDFFPGSDSFEGEIFLKLELFQKTGTFKFRGAIHTLLKLSQEELKRGVTAVSAGNHAVAVACAAKMMGTSAKVVMLETSNIARRKLAQDYGAEVLFAPNVHQAFEQVRQIEKEEGRFLVHPFEGPWIAQGTATIGLELCEGVSNLDAVIVPIGGGGLCAGISTAVKLCQPNCKVYGVEPEGANTMQCSLIRGQPQRIEKVSTIADSLGAPHAAPYSFELCQKYVDEVVTVSDRELVQSMSTF